MIADAIEGSVVSAKHRDLDTVKARLVAAVLFEALYCRVCYHDEL